MAHATAYSGRNPHVIRALEIRARIFRNDPNETAEQRRERLARAEAFAIETREGLNDLSNPHIIRAMAILRRLGLDARRPACAFA